MVDKTPPSDERETTGGFHPEAAPSLADLDVFEVLSDRRRRYVLSFLMNTENHVAELDEIADQIQQWERDADGDVPDDHRERIVASLYHVDIPKLADNGLVEFDPRSRTVKYHRDALHEAVLELVTDVDGG